MYYSYALPGFAVGTKCTIESLFPLDGALPQNVILRSEVTKNLG